MTTFRGFKRCEMQLSHGLPLVVHWQTQAQVCIADAAQRVGSTETALAATEPVHSVSDWA